MSPGPEYHGATRVPNGLMKVLGKKYSLRILEATMHEARTARDLIQNFDIPRTTLYRRLEALEEQHLLVTHGDVDLERGAHKTSVQSNLRELRLGENAEALTFELDLKETPQEVWGRAWKTMRRPKDVNAD